MDNITTIVNKINSLGDSAIFYLSNDPERALGLEQLLKNYHLVYIDKSQFTDYFKINNIKYFCLDEHLDQEVYRSSYKLISNEHFLNYFQLQRKHSNYIQTFKISPAFAQSVTLQNAKLLNTSAKLNRLFENKISQYQQFKELDIKLPKTSIVRLDTIDYQQLASEFGPEFVIQFDRGHTGMGTLFIKQETDLQNVKDKFPQREVKVCEYIKGEAYTLNACVGRQAIFMGGLSWQITGVPELTGQAGGTVGNDFATRVGITGQTLEQIKYSVKSIGEKMRQEGYLGLFGVDMIVRDEQAFIIEINARQPASIPMYTKMQLLEEQVPLSLIHLAEFMQITYELDAHLYNEQNLLPLQFSQIFIRALQDTTIESEVKMGNYRLMSDVAGVDPHSGQKSQDVIFLDEERDKCLILQKLAYNVRDLEPEQLLVLAAAKGRLIQQGNELARVQLRTAAVGDNGQVKPWIVEVLKAIAHYQK